MGNLHQPKTNVPVGGIMRIGGLYDTHGRVMALRDSGNHLIRGLGHQRPSG